jgi:glycosyltransferase involved in cell wall biosynthesis
MFNEATRLAPDEFIRGIELNAALGIQLHLLLVNDGSKDATADVARALVARSPERMGLLDLPTNAGKAEAVRAGLRQASQRFDIIGYWDADLATPFGELAPMVEILVEHPHIRMVLGSRVRLLGRQIERNPVRHILGRVFATAASVVLDLPVYDTQCGAKVLRRCAEVEQALEEPFLSRWAFDVELMARMMRATEDGPRQDMFVEHSLMKWVDVPGSKVRPSDLPRSLYDLLGVYRRSGSRLR